ncbi:MAG: hypothetical protein ACOC9T_02980 [Myxococcota bacterium]
MTDIQTRLDLARHLQEQMMRSTGSWLVEDEGQEEDARRTMLKSYLLEAHCPSDPDALVERLTAAGEAVGAVVERTQDPALFRLVHEDAELWCDTSLGRFWRLHTTALVKTSDRLHEQLVVSTPWLDKVWLSPTYLEQFPTEVGAEMLTFSLNHNRLPLYRRGEFHSDSDFVTLRLWSTSARKTLHKLRDANVFPRGVSLRSVRLRSDVDESDHYVAEYFHHGKVTASGTSFDEHNRLLLHALRDYAATITTIEDQYGIGRTEGPGGHLRGKPIVLDVEWAAPDLGFAVSKIFGSGEPFRLWGLPSEVAPGHYRTRAVDLHFGGVLVFDITSKQIVIQLPATVCGNTIARFLSNLRFHVNSDVRGPADLPSAGADAASRTA